MKMPTLGALLYGFFENHLKAQRGLSPATIRSYRDAVRLFLDFVAKDRRRKLTRLMLGDLTAERVGRFLNALEIERGNHIRSRNQRLTALKGLFDYLAAQVPEAWEEAERVAAIPTKRVAPPRTFFLERDELEALFAQMPATGPLALRDRALLLFLYNTGARVQEVADLQVGNLELDRRRVHLHGKGDKWRACPLWEQTVLLLRELLHTSAHLEQDRPVFVSQRGQALTRFGIHKVVRRHTRTLAVRRPASQRPAISPHVFRHTTATHLLEAGVEPNVIRDWLGHVSLETTNRYAEINIAMKEKALEVCAPPTHVTGGFPKRAIWRSDPSLLKWLQSL
jgi:site-specific recombinase XerD